MTGKHVTLRAFALAFAASFLLLGCAAAYTAFHWLPRVQFSVDEPEPPLPQDAYIPREEDSVTVLLIGSETDDGAPCYFTLARFRVVYGQIPVLTLPRQTALVWQGGTRSLETIAADEGPEAAAQALAKTFSIPVDRWVRWEPSGCEALINLLGPVRFTLPFALEYEGVSRHISLMPGMQKLDGKKFFDVISYPRYVNELTRTDMISKVTAAFFNQNLPRLTPAAGTFGDVLDHVETNLTAEDYARLSPMLNFYAGLSETISSHVLAEGVYDAAGSLFTPRDAFYERVKLYFAPELSQ